MQLHLFNTLTRQVEPFEPLEPGKVKLYTCGPTVYNYAHVGNLRTYVFEDILRRTLEKFKFHVEHVMNITDVGHLESDADEGDDKMALASKREKKSPWDIAKFYEKEFFKDADALHIVRPTLTCRATEHIDTMQKMVQGLIDNGLAYVVDGNVYFEVSKFPEYTRLSKQNLDDLLEGARVDIDTRKRDQRDFVLWFSKSKFPNQIMKWDSPWGDGFPGWHIECSAMASEYLGESIDIHCGGIDHISVHHTNEIAQAEGYFGHKWVNTWMHGEFLVLDKAKMSKSAGGFLTLKGLIDKGFDAVHYRYMCLGAHYRSELKFSFEALEAAKNAFETLKNRVVSWKFDPKKGKNSGKKTEYLKRFDEALANDLDMPIAMSVLWEAVRDAELGSEAQLELLKYWDSVLGLGVESFDKPELSAELMALVKEREEARAHRDWAKSDALRDQLLEQGICLKDGPSGTDWYLRY